LDPPDPKRFQTSVQVFVRTGGKWGRDMAPPYNVTVGTVQMEGNLGAPANLPNGTESITPVLTVQGTGAVRVIDLHHQFAAKFSAYHSRQLIMTSTTSIFYLETMLQPYTTSVTDSIFNIGSILLTSTPLTILQSRDR